MLIRSTKWAVLCAVLGACSSQVLRDNPLDPDNPGPKTPGHIKGRVFIQQAITQEGVTIHIFDAAGVEQATPLTDENGRFISSDLQAGVFNVTVETPIENVPVSLGGVEVTPGEDTDIGLLSSGIAPPEGQIAGQVSVLNVPDAPEGDGTLDPNLSLANIKVVAQRKVGEHIETWNTFTDAEGRYFFNEMPPGYYEVFCDKEGLTPDFKKVEILPQRAPIEAPAMKMYPASAVVRFSITNATGAVIGAPYTNHADIDLLLLAFGGVNEMRFSENPRMSELQTDEGGAEHAVDVEAFRPHLAQTGIVLSEGEGKKTVHAQFRVVDTETQLERLRTEHYTASVILDLTPPEVVQLDVAPDVERIGGRRYLRDDLNAVPVELVAYDAYSTVSGIKVVVEDKDPAVALYQEVSTLEATATWNTLVTLSGSDGEKRIGIQLRDGAGNESAVFYTSVFVDRTPPVALSDPWLSVKETRGNQIISDALTLVLDVGARVNDQQGPGGDGPVLMRVGEGKASLTTLAWLAFQREVRHSLTVAHGGSVRLAAEVQDQAGNVLALETPIYTVNLRGSISGTAFLEGVPDTEGAHGGTLVEVFAGGNDSIPVATATTGADGTFSIANLLPRTYVVRLSHPGMVNVFRGPVAVAAAEETSLGVERLDYARGNLGARFGYADRGASESRAGILVRLLQGANVVATTVTDDQGRALFGSVPALADYELQASAEGYFGRSFVGLTVVANQDTWLANRDTQFLSRLSGAFKLCASDDDALPPSSCTPILYSNASEALLGFVADAAEVGFVRYVLADQAEDALDAFTTPGAAPSGDGLCAEPPAADCWNPYDEATRYLIQIDSAERRHRVVLQMASPGPEVRVEAPTVSEIVYDATAPHDPVLTIEPGVKALLPEFTNNPEVAVNALALALLSGSERNVAPLAFVGLSRDDQWQGHGNEGDRGYDYDFRKTFSVESGTDGPKTIYAVVCDAANNCTDPLSASIILDRTPPSRDNGTNVVPGGNSVSVRSEAARTFWARSAQYEVSVSLGNSGFFVGNAVARHIADVAAYQLSLSAQFAGANWRYADPNERSAGDLVVDAGETLRPLDGDYRVYTRFMDAAGNVSQGDALDFVLSLDTTPPAGRVLLGTPGDDYINSVEIPVTLEIDVNAPATKVQYSWTPNLPELSAAREPFPVGGHPDWALPEHEPDGVKTLTVRFFDDAGNFSERNAKIGLDRTAPDEGSAWAMCDSCTEANGRWFYRDALGQVSYRLFAYDAASGVTDVLVIVDQGTDQEQQRWEIYSPVVTFTVSIDQGPHRLDIAFYDWAGNIRELPTQVIEYDTVAPCLRSVSLNDEADWSTSNTTRVTLSAFDGSAGCDGDGDAAGLYGMWVSTSATFGDAFLWSYAPGFDWAFPGVGDGDRTLYVRVRDLAGNTAQASATIRIDTLAPRLRVGLQGNTAAGPSSEVTGYGEGGAPTRDVTVELGVLDDGTPNPADLQMQVANTTVGIAALPWRTLEEVFTHTLAGPDGNNVVYFRVKDLAGHVSEASASIFLDTAGPYGADLDLGGHEYTRTPSVVAGTVAYDVSEMCWMGDVVGASTDECVANGWSPYRQSAVVTLDEGSGTKSIRIVYRDQVGWRTDVLSRSLVLDPDPPQNVQVTLNGGNEFARGTSVSIEVSAEDTVSGLAQMAVMNEAQNCAGALYDVYSAGRLWELVRSDGARTVYVCVRDRAGNTAASSDRIILDRVPPGDLELTIDDGSGSARARAVTLTIGATDAQSNDALTMQLSENDAFLGAAVEPLRSPIDEYLLSIGDGMKVLHLRVYDEAGNWSDTAQAVLLDTTDPYAELLVLSPSDVTNSPFVTAQFSVNDASQYCLMGDVAGASADGCTALGWSDFVSSALIVLNRGDGPKTVEVVFRDASDRRSQPARATVVLDELVPYNQSLVIDSDRLFTRSRTVSVALAVSDDGSGVTQVALANASSINCDTAAYEGFSFDKTWSLPRTDGDYTVSACFRDRAGNYAVASDSIELDAQAPTGVSIRMADGAYYATAPENVSARLFASGAAEMCVMGDVNMPQAEAPFAQPDCLDLGNWAWEPYADGRAVTLSSTDGLKWVSASFRDEAGNVSQVSDFIDLDTQAPSEASLELSPTDYTNSRNVTAVLRVKGADEMCLRGDIEESPPDCGDDSTGWEDAVSTKPLVLTADGGPKSVYAKFRDYAGWIGVHAYAADDLSNEAEGEAEGEVSDMVFFDTSAPSADSVTMTGLSASNQLTGATQTSTAHTRNQSVTVSLEGFNDGGGSGIVEMMVSESLLFVGSTWRPYSETFDWFLSAGDGYKTLYVKVRDRGGRESGVAEGHIILDTTPPDVGVSVWGQGLGDDLEFTRTAAVKLYFTDREPAQRTRTDLADVRVANDSNLAAASWEGYPFGGPKSWSLLADNAVRCRRPVVINEWDPQDATARVELANFTGVAVDLSKWTFECHAAGASSTWQIGTDVVLADGGYLVLAEAALGTCVWTKAGSGHGILKNALGRVVDFVRFGGSTEPAPLELRWDEAADGALSCSVATESCQRTSLGFDRDQRTDFCSAAETFGVGNAGACGLTSASCAATDGAKTVYLTIRDAAGNESVTTTSITLDETPPTATVRIAEGAAYVIYRDRVFTGIVATDNASGVTDMMVSDDPAAIPTIGDPAQPYWESYWGGYFRSFATDGQKKLFVRLRDRAGNETPVWFSDAVTIDTAAPTAGTVAVAGVDPVAVQADANTSETSSTSVTVTLSGFDDGAAGSGIVEMKTSETYSAGTIESDWRAYITPFRYDLTTGDEVKYFKVMVRDAAGLETDWVSRNVHLDTTPPTAYAVVLGPSLLRAQDYERTNARNVSVDLTNSDGGTGVAEYRFSRSLPVSGDWLSYSGLAASDYPGYEKRRAWNLINPETLTCRRSIVINELLTAASAQVELANGTGMAIDLNGWTLDCTNVDASTSRWTIPDLVLANGGYLALHEATGTNGAANRYGMGDCAWDGVQAGTAVLRDARGQEVDRVAFGGGGGQPICSSPSCVRTSLGFDRDSAADFCASSSATMGAANASADTCGLSTPDCSTIDGTRTVYVQLRDSVGNVGEASASILLDTTPPTGSISIESDATYYTSGQAVYAYITASNDPTGVQERMLAVTQGAAGTWEYISDGWSYHNFAAEGARKVYARLRDGAGNESVAWFSDSIIIDTNRPAVRTLMLAGTDDVAGGGAQTKTAEITVTVGGAADVGTGLTQFLLAEDAWWRIDSAVDSDWQAYDPDGNPATDTQVAWTLTGGDGGRTIYVWARDAAGNVSDRGQATIVQDTVAPSIQTLVLGPSLSIVLDRERTNARVPSVDLWHDDFGGTDAAEYRFSTSSTFAAGGWRSYAALAAPDPNPYGYTRRAATWDLISGFASPSSTCRRGVYLNELVTTAANAQVEVVNFSGVPVNLAGWRVVCGTAADTQTWTLSSSSPTVLAHSGYLALSESVYGACDWDGAAAGYAVLYDVLNREVDFVRFNGSAQTGASAASFLGGAPSCGASNVCVRTSQGFDRNESADWCPGTTATPGAGNPGSDSCSLTANNCPSIDGVIAVYAQVRDNVGNISATSASILLDTTPPTATVSTHGGAPYFTAQDAAIALGNNVSSLLTADEDATGVVERNLTLAPATPGGWEGFGDGRFYSALGATEGNRFVYARVRDNAGNESAAWLSDSIIVDTVDPTAPTVTLAGTDAINNDGTQTSTTVITITLSGATDTNGTGISHMLFVEDDSTRYAWAAETDWVACTQQAPCMGTAQNWALVGLEGTRTIYAWVRDAAGNISEAGSATIVLDMVAPYIGAMVLGPSVYYDDDSDSARTRARFVSLDLDDSDSTTGVVQYRLSRTSIFSGDWSDYTALAASPTGGYDKRRAAWDLKDATAYTCRKTVLINELVTAATARVEIANFSGAAVDLTGWDLVCGTASGTTVWTLPDFALANSSYVALNDGAGTNSSTQLYFSNANCGWSGSDAGYALLRNALDEPVDFVRFNDSTRPAPSAQPSVVIASLDSASATAQTTVANFSGASVDLTGWDLVCGTDAGTTVWTLTSFTLANHAYVTLNDGAGVDSATARYFPLADCGWGGINAGYALLRDASDQVVDFVRFNRSAQPEPRQVTLESGSVTCANTIVSCVRTSLGYDRDRLNDFCESTAATFGAANTDSCGRTSSQCTSIDGDTTVNVQVRDAVGNTASTTASISLDVTPPTATIQLSDASTGSTSYLTDSSRYVTLSVSETGGGTDALDAYWTATPGTLPDPVLWSPQWGRFYSQTAGADGKLYVRLRDEAGNDSLAYFSDSLTVDGAAPSSTLASVVLVGADAGGSSTTRSNTATVTVRLAGFSDLVTTTKTNLGLQLSEYSDFWDATWVSYPGDYVANDDAPTTTFTFASGDGAKTLYVRVRDQAGADEASLGYSDAGHVSDTVTVSITLDTTAPFVSFYIEGTDAVGASDVQSNVRAVDLRLRASDDGVGIQGIRVWRSGESQPDSWTAVSTEATPTAFSCDGVGSCTYDNWDLFSGAASDGETQVFIELRDFVGNSATADDAIVFDGSGPTGELSINSAATYSGSRSLTLTITASDRGTGLYQMRVNQNQSASSLVTYEETYGFTLPDAAVDGMQIVYVQLQDAAGNTSAWISDTIILDTTAPTKTGATVTLTGEDKDGSSTSITRFRRVVVALGGDPGFADAQSGITQMMVSEDSTFSDATWQDAQTRFLRELTEGDEGKFLYVVVRDAVGNAMDITDAVAGTITLDQTAPNNGVVSINDDATYANSTTVTATFYVSGDAVQWLPPPQPPPAALPVWTACSDNDCSDDSDDPESFASQTLQPGPRQGPRRFTIRFRDAAGNVSEPFYDDIYYDATIPTTAEILSVAARTTSAFVDLDDESDPTLTDGRGIVWPGSGVDYYEVAVKRASTNCSDGTTITMPTFDVSEGWVTGVPGLEEFGFCARAVDRAGNQGGWTPVPKTIILGLTATLVDGYPNMGALGARMMSYRGQVFFPRITPVASGSDFEILSCDARRQRCQDSVLRRSARAPILNPVLTDVAMAVSGNGVALFGRSATTLEATFHRGDPDLLSTLNNWSVAPVELKNGLGTPVANTLVAGANGRMLYVAYFVDEDADNDVDSLMVHTCLESTNCALSASWSDGLEILDADDLADAEYFLSPGAVGGAGTYLSAAGGEGHLWLAYPARGANHSVAVVGCAVSYADAGTPCSTAAEWSQALVAADQNGSDVFVRAAAIVEHLGSLWVLSLRGTGLGVSACTVDNTASSPQCTAGTDFAADVQLQSITQPFVISGRSPSMPRLTVSSWGGYLYTTVMDYASGKVYFGRCNDARFDCMASARWTLAPVLTSGNVRGQPIMAVDHGNPVLFVGRDQSRAFILESYTPAPLQRALLPDFATGGVKASWVSMEPEVVDGYRVDYNTMAITNPLNERALVADSVTENLAISSGSNPHFGVVATYKGQDLGIAEPRFSTRSLGLAEGARELSDTVQPRYAASGVCQAVAYVGFNNRVYAATCAANCGDISNWTTPAVELRNLGAAPADLAVGLGGGRLFVASSLAGQTGQLLMDVRDVGAGCTLSGTTAVSLGNLGDRPSRISIDVTLTLAVVAYRRNDTTMTFGRCNPSAVGGCSAEGAGDGQWKLADTTVASTRGGPVTIVDFSVTTRYVYFAPRYDPSTADGVDERVELWRSNNGGAAWQVTYTLTNNTTGWADAASLVSQNNHLLYTGGDTMAWCRQVAWNNGVDCTPAASCFCDSAEDWNRGWFSAELLAPSTLPVQIGILGVDNGVGDESGESLMYVGLANGGYSLGRCNNQCFLPDNWIGGYTDYSTLSDNTLRAGASHNGPVGSISATGQVSIVFRYQNAENAAERWRFINNATFDFRTP